MNSIHETHKVHQDMHLKHTREASVKPPSLDGNRSQEKNAKPKNGETMEPVLPDKTTHVLEIPSKARNHASSITQ